MSLTIEARPPIRAAQYLRMSTEHQRYSPDNQRHAIARYAAERGYEIVKTYVDSGKSGLTLKGRDGLKQLLSDAVSGASEFNAILVLDVSRWGRFQDTDQGSHYEWLCKSAGVAVHYVQEPFEQDGSATASIIKQLKRVMAAEYSRELSVKVAAAQMRYASMGFLQGGIVPYGVRRMLVDEAGNPKGILEQGQWKPMRSDRILPVPGPQHEIDVINRIFRLYLRKRSCQRIADVLNRDGIPAVRGKAWTYGLVYGVIYRDWVLGMVTFNRTSTRLKERWVQNPREEWVQVQVFPPLVDPAIVKAARATSPHGQAAILDNRKLLRDLRRLKEKHGRITYALIKKEPYMAHPNTYKKHFGSLDAAYRLVGLNREEWTRIRRPAIHIKRSTLLAGLRHCYETNGRISAKLVDADPCIPSEHTYTKIFGRLSDAYRLAGIPYTDRVTSAAKGRERALAEARANSDASGGA
jgi:DNA invertase Pin-like site-specific DNA recombinase